MTTHVCPKGHRSAESDYCSECGAKIIQSASESLATAGNAALVNDYDLTSTTDPFAAPVIRPSSIDCPACAAPHLKSDGNFCEICGYNFTTGQPADVPIVTLTPSTAVAIPVTTDPITADRSKTSHLSLRHYRLRRRVGRLRCGLIRVWRLRQVPRLQPKPRSSCR
jgi:Double zinc ribbon